MSTFPTDFLGRVFFLADNFGESFLRGAGATFAIAVISTIIGCIIGFAVGIVQTVPTDKSENKVKWFFMTIVKFLLNAYVELFRGTPMMAQAMFIYFGALPLLGIHMNMWQVAIFIVSINTGAYMSETVRGGILSIDTGQTEGAKAIGMTHVQSMLYVILPQAFRNLIPQIGNNLIINIKDTCVLSVIGVVELFFTTKGITGAYYAYFEAFSIALAIYFIMTFTCSKILRRIEDKLDGDDNYDLATTDTLTHTSGLYKYREKKPNVVGNFNLDTRDGGR